MKYIITFIFVIFFLSGIAQDNYYKPGLGFNSEFQNVKSGNFEGTVTGYLRLKSDNKEKSASFYKTNATLSVEQDENEIYDVSVKRYSTKNNDIEIEYSTYNYANALLIRTVNGSYKLTLIDGVCLSVINNLEYEYIDSEEKELLVLYCNDDIKLKKPSDCDALPLYVMKGSTLIFEIAKK